MNHATAGEWGDERNRLATWQSRNVFQSDREKFGSAGQDFLPGTALTSIIEPATLLRNDGRRLPVTTHCSTYVRADHGGNI